MQPLSRFRLEPGNIRQAGRALEALAIPSPGLVAIRSTSESIHCTAGSSPAGTHVSLKTPTFNITLIISVVKCNI